MSNDTKLFTEMVGGEICAFVPLDQDAADLLLKYDMRLGIKRIERHDRTSLKVVVEQEDRS